MIPKGNVCGVSDQTFKTANKAKMAFHVDTIELAAISVKWDVRKIFICLWASLRNVPFSLVQSTCLLVKVIYKQVSFRNKSKFTCYNPAELRTMVDKQQEKALDIEGGGGKHAEAGRRETKKEIGSH